MSQINITLSTSSEIIPDNPIDEDPTIPAGDEPVNPIINPPEEDDSIITVDDDPNFLANEPAGLTNNDNIGEEDEPHPYINDTDDESPYSSTNIEADGNTNGQTTDDTTTSVSVPNTGYISNESPSSINPFIPVASLVIIFFLVTIILFHFKRTYKNYSLNKSFNIRPSKTKIIITLISTLSIGSLLVNAINNQETQPTIATAENSLTVSVDNINLKINRVDNNSAYKAVKSTITIENSTTNGYTLGIYASGNDIVSQENDANKITSISSGSAKLTENTWGISLKTPQDQNSTTWNSIPTSQANALTIKTTNSATNANDKTAVYYGAYINSDLPDGVYTGPTLNYFAVANIVEPTLIPDPNDQPDNIYFINTGNSNSFLLESNGHYGLVDSSNPYNDGTLQSVSTAAYSVSHVVSFLQKIGVKKLDFIIATHSHSDHIGGMPTIAKNYVDSNTIYYYRPYIKTQEDTDYRYTWDNQGYYNRAISAMEEKGVTLKNVTNKSPSIKLGDFTIKLYNTEPAVNSELDSSGLAKGENYNSITQLITYGDKKVFLAADLEKIDESKIAKTVGKVNILQMGHHGLDSSTSTNFIKTLQPKDVIIPTKNMSENRQWGSIGRSYKNYNTSFYITNGVSNAIVAKFANNDYTIVDYDNKNLNKAKIKFNSTENNEGEWLEAISLDYSYWLHFDKSGNLDTSWKQLKWNNDTSWYYFNTSSGAMVTGWRQINWNGSDYWFYFGTNGKMVTGWKKIYYNDKYSWFYFRDDGTMVSNTGQYIDNSYYYFNSDGVCIQGNGCY